MSSSSKDRVRGSLLREWRFSQKWDATLLAQKVNLSIGQIHQLETGGTSLFYSLAIRENAARKVALALGGDPDAIIDVDSEPDASVERDSDQERAPVQRPRSDTDFFDSLFGWMRSPGRVSLVFLTCLTLFGFSAWVQKSIQSDVPTPLWPLEVTQEPLKVAEVREVREVQENFAPPLSLGHSVGKSAHDDLCKSPNQHAPAVTPNLPEPSSNMVFIWAKKDGAVCVTDALGTSTSFALKTNEGRRVEGVSPWLIKFQMPQQVELYLQGQRMSGYEPDAVFLALQEGQSKGRD